MPNIKFQTTLPASPEQVFEHITSFPADGEVNQSVLEKVYGRIVDRDGDTFTFEDRTEDHINWACTFDPPSGRIMKALESKWADRYDWFEETPDGTRWTVVWVPKASGFTGLVQWVGVKLRGNAQIYRNVVAPVIRHFQEPAPAPTPAKPPQRRTMSRRVRRNRRQS